MPKSTNLSVVPNIVPPLSQKATTQWDAYLKGCPTRQSFCPVRKHAGVNNGQVTEYLVDIHLIQTDAYYQNRLLGALANKISELANQLHTCAEGLKVGICVALGQNGDLLLRWGNHRFRATKQNNGNNLAIPNMPVGKIWASIYDLPTSQVRKWQAVENNVHDVSSPATKDDNVLSLKEMVVAGELDTSDSKFVDCDDEEKDKRLGKIIQETMPSWSTASKIKTLIKEFRRQNTNVYRVESYTASEMKDYFKKNCPLHGELDFSSYTGSSKNIIRRKLRDGTIRTSKVAFTHEPGEVLGGAIFQTALQAKFVDADCDEFVLVSCHSGKAEAGLNSVRQDRETLVRTWNSALPGGSRTKLIDKIFVLPQTTVEKKGSKFFSKKSL